MGVWYWDRAWKKNNMFRSNTRADAILACPGPSLRGMVSLSGPNRLVFGINTSYPTIRPDIWIGMDEVWCYDPNLVNETFPKIFRGTYSETFCDEGKLKEMPFTYFADVSPPPAGKTMLNLLTEDAKFSWHYHTLGVALHIIMWMGFKKIFLVGCDLGGNKDYCHDLILSAEQRSRNQKLYNQQTVFIHKLAKESLKHGIEIISSTENSPINKFIPYTPIQDIANCKLKRNKIRYVVDRPCTPVTVLRTGGEYKVEHVLQLATQVPDLVCFSDVDIPGIKTIKLRHSWPGWWSKLEIFRPDALLGDLLYIDLDTIVKDIKPFLSVGRTTMLRDFYYPEARASGLMYIHENDKEKVYEDFVKNYNNIITSEQLPPYHGDQGFLNKTLKSEIWQDLLPGKVVSYKVHGITEEAKIICFHGKPKPWDIKVN